MQRTLAEQLLASASADFESPAELLRAHQFVLEVLQSVRHLLPVTVRSVIESLGPVPLRWSDSESQRVLLWNSIKHDTMGTTAAGAATRAALFAFPEPGTGSHTASDLLCHFEWFYSRAGLPQEPLVAAFRRYWPSVTPKPSREPAREG